MGSNRSVASWGRGSTGAARRDLRGTGPDAHGIGGGAGRHGGIPHQHADSTTVTSGSTVTLEVRATFDTNMTAARLRLVADRPGMVQVIDRVPGVQLSSWGSIVRELVYITTGPSQPEPFQPGLNLPHLLAPSSPLDEVLMSITKAYVSGHPLDGLAPGQDVLVNTLTLRLVGHGPVTVSALDPSAAETQSDPSGALFTSVSLLPGGDQITFNISLNADFDGDVDMDDFALFQACLTHSPDNPLPGCEPMDLTGDGCVDLDCMACM